MKKSHWLLPPLSAIVLSVLVACGGGGSGGPTATPQNVQIGTYITDNLAQDYSQVWVQILKITAVDASGAEVTLFEAPSAAAATPVNLAELASVGQWLSQASVPAGTYHQVKVTLADSIRLVPKDGSAAIDATLGGQGSPVTIGVELEMEASANASLVLDFDLARFTYDAATNRVVPTIVKRAEGDLGKFVRNQAELHGTVVSVGTDSLVVDDRHLGAGVTVKLAKDAVIFDEATRKAVDLSALTAGTHVEAHVVLLPKAQPTDPTVVEAALVRIEPSDGSGAASGEAEGAGVVTAVDTHTTNGVTTTTVTVELHEASFMPSAGTVTVDASNAVFSHGTLADLAVGVAIEFHGAAGSGGIVASRIEIEGAASEQEREQHPAMDFVEARGTVDSVNGTSFVLTVAQASERLAAGQYTVDASQALFTSGRANCLAAGETVEAKGLLDTSTSPSSSITAGVVEIEGGCPAQ